MALKNITYFGQATNRTQVRENIIWYLKDAFLNAGGYYNITSGVLILDGTGFRDSSLLEPTSDSRRWRGISHDWVWETGINPSYAGGEGPFRVSGVYVEDVFYPTGTVGNYAHTVDYNQGCIVFNSPVPSGTKVWAERSERAAFVYPAESNEYRQIMYEHRRVFDDHPGSGQDIFPQTLKAFLPAVFIDVSHKNNRAYELGSSSQRKTFGIEAQVFSEDLSQFDFLRDACISLENGAFMMFDANQVSANNAYPHTFSGTLSSENAQMFSGLVDLYPWKRGNFTDRVVERSQFSPLPLQVSTINLEFQLVG